MRAIHLDFAQRPQAHRALTLVLLAAGLLALVWVLLRLTLLSTDVDRLKRDVDDAQRASRHERRVLKPVAGEDKEAALRELARANGVVASLNLGWSGLFRQLESVQRPGVTLLAVQPETGSTRRLRLSGEARRLEDALAYVKQMAGTAGFDKAHLISHEAVADGPRQTVRFALVVDWVGQR